MKQLHLNTKQYNHWIKGIVALSLLIALPAKSCNARPGTLLARPNVMSYTLKNIDVDEFRQQVANTKDISDKWLSGRNYLYDAIDSNEPVKVKIILDRLNEDKRGDFQYQDKDFPNSIDLGSKKTAFQKAIEKGNEAIVKLLAQNEYINVNNVGNASTSLLVAIGNKRKTIAQFLLDNCPKLDIKTKDLKSGSTPLHLAIEHGFEDLTKSLVNKLSVDSLYAKDKKQRTPMHTATYNNRENEFKVLYNKIYADTGVSKLLEKDVDGCSVIAYAYLPKPTILSKLINSKSDTAMFNCVLQTAGHHLTPNQWTAISDEIYALQNKGKINQKDADTIQDIVTRYANLHA